jgi:hypothetical protein
LSPFPVPRRRDRVQTKLLPRCIAAVLPPTLFIPVSVCVDQWLRAVVRHSIRMLEGALKVD